MNKHFLTTLALALGSFGTAWAQPAKPNVIIVLSDDQGYGDLSITGNPLLKTPALDQFAREGIRLENFHSNPVCSPTRASLMTGRFSERVGVWHCQGGRDMLRDGEVTMAEVFRHNGYHTGIFGKWHLGTNYPYRPIDRGFEQWFGACPSGVGHTGDFWNNDRVNDTYLRNGVRETKPRPGYTTAVLFDEAMAFIKNNKSQPFFAYIPTYASHGPNSVPDRNWTEPYRHAGSPPSAEYTKGHFAAIANLDQNFGRLRQFLKDEGLADNTLVVFAGDNGSSGGAAFFNAGMRGKKADAYEGGHRVFCAMQWPTGKLAHATQLKRLTSCMDMLPTFVDLCDLKLPRPVKFDGTSIRKLLENPAADWPDRTLIAGFFRTHPYAVMTDRWRLVGKQLFDMADDPAQKKNVAAQYPDEAKKLHAAFEDYLQSVKAETKGWSGSPIIGTTHQALVELSPMDWYRVEGSNPYHQGAVAVGVRESGTWHVRFAASDNYHFEVRRWPVDANAPITGKPAPKKQDAWINNKPLTGTLYENASAKALTGIASVRIKVGDTVQEKPVPAEAAMVAFDIPVTAGPSKISAVFLDQNGKTICGGYYVYAGKTAISNKTENTGT